MDKDLHPTGRDPRRGDEPIGVFAALGRGDRHFSFGRKLLIGIGVACIVGAVALVAYKAITASREVFQRGADRFNEVE